MAVKIEVHLDSHTSPGQDIVERGGGSDPPRRMVLGAECLVPGSEPPGRMGGSERTGPGNRRRVQLPHLLTLGERGAALLGARAMSGGVPTSWKMP